MIAEPLKRSIEVKEKLLQDQSTLAVVEQVAKDTVTSLRNDGKVLFCGNGGSAADAQHLAAELQDL